MNSKFPAAQDAERLWRLHMAAINSLDQRKGLALFLWQFFLVEYHGWAGAQAGISQEEADAMFASLHLRGLYDPKDGWTSEATTHILEGYFREHIPAERFQAVVDGLSTPTRH